MTRQKMDKKVAQHPFLVQTGLTAFLSTGGLSLSFFMVYYGHVAMAIAKIMNRVFFLYSRVQVQVQVHASE